jgi:hypothetical protein
VDSSHEERTGFGRVDVLARRTAKGVEGGSEASQGLWRQVTEVNLGVVCILGRHVADSLNGDTQEGLGPQPGSQGLGDKEVEERG